MLLHSYHYFPADEAQCADDGAAEPDADQEPVGEAAGEHVLRHERGRDAASVHVHVLPAAGRVRRGHHRVWQRAQGAAPHARPPPHAHTGAAGQAGQR
jgi:hypothetical protein